MTASAAVALIALLLIIIGLYVIARAVRGASTDTPRTPGGDDQHRGMYK